MWTISILLACLSSSGCALLSAYLPNQPIDPAVAYKSGPYANWENYLSPEDEKARSWGEALYKQAGCVRCHGEKADGNSYAAITTFKNTPRKPANLTTGEIPDSRFMHSMTYGAGPGSGMAKYGMMLTEWERAAIIAYVRSLPESHPPQPTQ